MSNETNTPSETSAAAEVIAPGRRRRFGRARWTLVALGALVVVLLAAVGGVAYATYDYTRRYEGRILPGATIAGVDVGGLTEAEAEAAVERAVEPELTRTIDLEWADESWTVTPEELGAEVDVEGAVAAAMDASTRTSFVDRARMRLFGAAIDFDADAPVELSRRSARLYLEELAREIHMDVRDASIDYSTGWVRIVPERSGVALRVGRSHRRLMRALRSGGSEIDLQVVERKPEVTRRDFSQVLLLHIGENKLYLYTDGKISHTWTVATGQPEYPTPTGLYEIELKRYMPTWVNPDPDGWGADMPKSIPPGPGNPLGTRALNWSAPAIRFHGTSATYSLGYNASHGCVRMAMSDVETLYDLVEVGTPIVSLNYGGLRPQYSSAPDPIPVAEDVASD